MRQFGYRNEPIIAGRSEYDRFLEIQFMNLPEFAQKEILHERKTPDLQRVEYLLSHYPERFTGGTVDEKRQTIIERWQLEYLAPLAS